MKDWLGQEYGVGDKIIYAASRGNHGHNMIIAEVIKFNVATVTVRPLYSSRGGKRIQTGYIDERTNKPLNPYANPNWNSSDVWNITLGMDGPKRRKLQPYIKQVELPAKPVALKVTKNITKWHGEIT